MARRYITLAGPFRGEMGQMYVRCPACGEVLPLAEAREQAMVCPWCDFHFPWEATAHLELLADAGSFRPLAGSPAGPLLLGQATLHGRPVTVAVADGTVRWNASEVRALIALLEEARLERRPLLWVMAATQGTEAESYWPGVHLALKRLQAAGRPWLALLSGPGYGLPAATALQADLLLAEPGAVLRPARPEVLRRAGRLPPEVLRPPRKVLSAGWADAVLPRREQRAVLAHLLDLLGAAGPPPPRPEPAVPWPWPLGRPAGDEGDFFELHGDRCSGDDAALRGGLARLGEDLRLLLLATAQGRGRPAACPPDGIGAGGWRKATRLLLLAGRFGLPVVTLIGRSTLHLGRKQREAELSASLGEAMDTFLTLPVPTVAVALEGDDGPAGLALTAADALLALPEAAASLREKGLEADEEVATPEDLPEALKRHLHELLQTYAIHGPLGRSKLLQRRHVRWARLAAEAEKPLLRCSPMETGDET